jgi:uncharacterized sporulation protein YeaH/YhbH (DUF444 family)
MAARMAIIAMTTSNSMRVKARRDGARGFFMMMILYISAEKSGIMTVIILHTDVKKVPSRLELIRTAQPVRAPE